MLFMVSKGVFEKATTRPEKCRATKVDTKARSCGDVHFAMCFVTVDRALLASVIEKARVVLPH